MGSIDIILIYMMTSQISIKQIGGVWEGVVVEQSQIPKLKSLICKRARAAIGQPGDKLLRTVPGRGLVLEAKTKFVSNSAA